MRVCEASSRSRPGPKSDMRAATRLEHPTTFSRHRIAKAMDITPQTQTIRAQLVDLRVKTQDHWGVAKLRPVRGGGELKATGKFLGASVGDTVEVTGRMVRDARWGNQFKVSHCERLTPEGSAGTIAWLSSRLPNLGEARARALVEAFGDQLWVVIETDHEKLAHVRGITPARADAIRDAYLEGKADRDAVIALRDWGLTDGQIGRCRQLWGPLSEVIAQLQQDPYRLHEVDGFGFLRADDVARRMGVASDSPSRIAAGVAHLLREASGHGHTYVGGKKLQSMALRLLDLGEEHTAAVGRVMRDACADGRLALREGWRVYTPKLADAEQRVADTVRALLERGKRADAVREKGAA